VIGLRITLRNFGATEVPGISTTSQRRLNADWGHMTANSERMKGSFTDDFAGRY
jgi:hypothetical protein